MIEVRALRAADEAAYTAFLATRGEALLYHSLPYRDLLLDQLGCEAEYLVALEGGEIRGVLPTMRSGGVLNSLPFYGSHGGVVGDGADVLLAAWDERATDPTTRAATLVTNPFGPERRPPVHDFTDERLNQAIPLTPDMTEADVLERAEPSAARDLGEGAAARVRRGPRARRARCARGGAPRQPGADRRPGEGRGVLRGDPRAHPVRRLHRAARRRARRGAAGVLDRGGGGVLHARGGP